MQRRVSQSPAAIRRAVWCRGGKACHDCGEPVDIHCAIARLDRRRRAKVKNLAAFCAPCFLRREG